MEEERKELLSFSTEEHRYHNRTNDYYWTIGLIAFVVVILSFIFDNALFGVLVIIGIGMYFYVSTRMPKEFIVSISTNDIVVDDNVYNIDQIESFNILKIGDENNLIISVKRAYQPRVSVCLPDTIVSQVKETMLKILKEDKNLIPHIGRRFIAKYKL